jgi:hypothetical protein
VLNPPHRKMLNDAEVRPLDYDYLTKLSPGPQRLYELLSFQILRSDCQWSASGKAGLLGILHVRSADSVYNFRSGKEADV